MKKSNRKLIGILITTLVIILVASLEAMMKAKSSEVMNSFLYVYQGSTKQDFINFVLLRYLTNIVVPILVAIFMFILSRKISFSRVHLFIISGVIVIGLVNLIFTFNFNSVFYYSLITLNLLLLYFVSSYSNLKERNKVK